MKKTVIIIAIALALTNVKGQTEIQNSDYRLQDNLERTLDAATTVCSMAFAFQAIGIGFAAGAYISDGDSFGPLSVTAIIGSGGNGMELTNAKLAKRAAEQIKMLRFSPEDSLIRYRMLANVKTARKLAYIQHFAPFIGLAAGGLMYLVTGSPGVFAFTTLVLYSAGICTAIGEILLIDRTRKDLMYTRQRLMLGATSSGIGISYNF